MSHQPYLSVVIPTLNREASLCKTILYFVEEEMYRPFEIIVVDQSGSHLQETEAFLEAVAPKIRYVRVNYKGLTRARNHGVRLADGEVVVFVDDDVEPKQGFLAAHAAAYEDPKITGVAGPVPIPGQRLRTTKEVGRNFHKMVRSEVMAFNEDFVYEASWAPGGNMSFRKSCIERLGGFDENFFGVATGEDAEFSHRVRLAGGKIRFEPAAFLYHVPAQAGGCHDVPEEGRRLHDQLANSIYFWSRVAGLRTGLWMGL